MDQISGNGQNGFSVVFLCHFVEKFDDVSEVHISVQNDISIIFHQSHGHKEVKVDRGHLSGSPDCFPNQKDITVSKFSLKVQQKPPKISNFSIRFSRFDMKLFYIIKVWRILFSKSPKKSPKIS